MQKGVSVKIRWELEETWKRMSTQLDLEFSTGVANVHAALKQDHQVIHRQVGQCKVVVENQVSALQAAAHGNSASSVVGGSVW